MIFRRARSASRFTVAPLNFGRESLRDALKRDTKLCRWRQCPCSLAEQRLEGDAGGDAQRARCVAGAGPEARPAQAPFIFWTGYRAR